MAAVCVRGSGVRYIGTNQQLAKRNGNRVLLPGDCPNSDLQRFTSAIPCKLLFSTKGVVFPERCSNLSPVRRGNDFSQTLLVSQTGCNCNFSAPLQCTGYQSAADLSPITAFQVNVVGPGGGSTTSISGAGNILYESTNANLALIPLAARQRAWSPPAIYARQRPRTCRTGS